MAHPNPSKNFRAITLFLIKNRSIYTASPKHHEKKLMHPSSSRAFQSYQEHDLKHPSLINLIIRKQNMLPCFMDRYAICACF
jgi:hypothetical protein